jgi:DNA polymerase delta subunit 3
MLAEFYKTQNAKKPNSVHCTYIVTGISRDHRHTNGANGQHAGDTAMRSSPPMSSMPQAAGEGGPDEEESSDTDSDDESTQVKETAILLVSEEDLKGV